MNMIWISHEYKRPFTSIPASCVCVCMRAPRAITSKQRSNWYTPPTHYIQSILITFGSRFFLVSVIVVHWFYVLFGFCVHNEITLWIFITCVLLNWDLPKHVLLPLEATDNLSRLLADPIQGNDCLTVRIIYNWNWLLMVMAMGGGSGSGDFCFSARINNIMSMWEQAYLFRIFLLSDYGFGKQNCFFHLFFFSFCHILSVISKHQ